MNFDRLNFRLKYAVLKFATKSLSTLDKKGHAFKKYIFENRKHFLL